MSEFDLQGWLAEALCPQPTPDGTSSREVVARAIEFAGPSRIPYSFVDPLQSDFFELAELQRILDRVVAAENDDVRKLGDGYRDEWGVEYVVAEGLFDRAVAHPLADLSDAMAQPLPDVAAPAQLARIAATVGEAHRAGKYVVAGDPVLLYERLRSLMGFRAQMLAPIEQRAGFAVLLDRLGDLTVDAVEGFASLGGVDAFMTWQDFGLQTQLALSVESFREWYAPRIARAIDAAHAAGMHFIWHCCGAIFDLIPEMIDLGVDVVQLDQPHRIGHSQLAESFGGRICFWNAVDTQWSTQPGLSDDALRAEVAAMISPFERFDGGFMARHYPQPGDIGLTRRFHDVTSRAFLAARRAGRSDG